MTTTAIRNAVAAPSAKAPMDRNRKLALWAGLFYIGTFVFSIPALALYDGVLNDKQFVFGHGPAGGVLTGGLIEILTALTGMGTAIAVYPILKRFSPARALGFVVSRTLEAAAIFMGVIAVLAVYTLRENMAGTDPDALNAVAQALVAVKDWTFLLGPGIMPAVNALCFATVLHRTGLVPRWIPRVGFVGGPLLIISSMCTLFGAFDQVTVISMLMALPIATWELSVGIYMAVKGFKKEALV